VRSGRSGARAAALTVSLLATALSLMALQLESEPLSPQSRLNQGIAEADSLAQAVGRLDGRWPPLYPMALRSLGAVGIPIHHANALLFLATLALLVPVGRRVAPRVDPAWWIALYAVASFNAFNLRQLASEALLIPLSLAAFYLASYPSSRRSRALDSGLAALLALSCLTRYFAAVSLLPVVGVALLWHGEGATRERISRAALITGAASLPVLAWMLYAQSESGFLTGMDRTTARSLFAQQTTLPANLLSTARAIFLDFLTPGEVATQAAVGLRWSWHPVGIVVGCGALGLAGLCTRVALRSAGSPAREDREAGRLALLLPGLSIGYLLLTIGVWSITNNDPIYTRFLYPSYVFFGLAGAHVYSHTKERLADDRTSRRPFQWLYGLLLGTHGAGTLWIVLRDLSAL